MQGGTALLDQLEHDMLGLIALANSNAAALAAAQQDRGSIMQLQGQLVQEREGSAELQKRLAEAQEKHFNAQKRLMPDLVAHGGTKWQLRSLSAKIQAATDVGSEEQQAVLQVVGVEQDSKVQQPGAAAHSVSMQQPMQHEQQAVAEEQEEKKEEQQAALQCRWRWPAGPAACPASALVAAAVTATAPAWTALAWVA